MKKAGVLLKQYTGFFAAGWMFKISLLYTLGASVKIETENIKRSGKLWLY